MNELCLCIKDCVNYDRSFPKNQLYKYEEEYNCYEGEYYYCIMDMNGKFLSYVGYIFFENNFVTCDGAIEHVDELFDKIFFNYELQHN